MSRELELMKQVVKEWEEELNDPDEPGHPTFVESLQTFRENLVQLDLADAMAGKGEEPFKLQRAEKDLAIVDTWLGTLAGEKMYTVHDLPRGVRVLIPHP